jgi:hypothetical protein
MPVLLTLRKKQFEKGIDLSNNLLNFVADEKLDVKQYLVISGTRCMNLFPGIANPAGKHQFHLGMNILHSVFNDKGALFRITVNGQKFIGKHLKLIFTDQADTFKHGNVGQGSEYVIPGKQQVEFTIFSDGELLDQPVSLNIFVPKFHGNSISAFGITIPKLT